MTSNEQLVQSIDTRIDQLRGEIDRLTQAREELVSTATVAAPSTATRTRRQPRRRNRGRAPDGSTEVVPAGKLHALLAAGDGMSTAELADKANADTAQVLPLLREMEAGGRVRRTGQRRGTRWHAVSGEEEWIAQRAAELAGRSRGA